MTFLSISNLNTSKGTFVLLDAAQLLLRHTSDFHVHFVGAPTAEISEGRMQEEIANRGLQKVVTYHGRQYGEDKEARFAEADCFVHPTLDDCFPLVILEAMQHSLPVIATPVGAIPDIIMDGVTGILIPIEQPESLALKLYDVIQRPYQYRLMGVCAQERVEKDYSLASFEEQLVKIIND